VSILGKKTNKKNNIEHIHKGAEDIVEKREGLMEQREINTSDLLIAKSILEANELDDSDLRAIEGLEEALQTDADIIDVETEKNEEDRKNILFETEEYIDDLDSSLDKFKKVKEVSTLVKKTGHIENSEKRIEELKAIRELLGGDDVEAHRESSAESGVEQSTDQVDSFFSERRERIEECITLDNIRPRKMDYALGILMPNVSLSRGYKAVLQRRVDIAESAAQSVFNTAAEEGKITFIDGAWTGISMFRPDDTSEGKRGIYINAWADEQDFQGKGSGTTFFHEVGHMIDYVFGDGDFLSSRGSFLKALQEDVNAIMEKMDKDIKWGEKFQDLIDKDPTASSISDILEGVTNGQLSGAYGHKASSHNYWKQEKYRVCNETFAHFFEASMGGSGIITSNPKINKLQRIKMCFPKAYIVFEGILAEIEETDPRVLERSR